MIRLINYKPIVAVREVMLHNNNPQPQQLHITGVFLKKVAIIIYV